MEETNEVIVIDESRQAVVAQLMRNVYIWMTGGLAITGMIAWMVANNPEMMNLILSSKAMFWGIFIAELALVIGLSAFIQKMSFLTASICYTVYCALNGLFMSTIFIIYELGSVGQVFFIAAGMFLALALIGSFTKKDLSRMGTFLIMALFGLIIASVIAAFTGNGDSLVLAGIGVLIFAGLTVYDAQKVRNMMLDQETVNEGNMKLALLGALTLYLDFINLFLKLLQLFGKRK